MPAERQIVGRSFAGVLGSLAWCTVLARGVLHGSAADEVLRSALLALLIWAAAGALLGLLAGWLIEDSLRAQLAAEVQAQQEQRLLPAEPGTPGRS